MSFREWHLHFAFLKRHNYIEVGTVQCSFYFLANAVTKMVSKFCIDPTPASFPFIVSLFNQKIYNFTTN